MNKFMKVLAICTAAAMMSVGFAGCGSADSKYNLVSKGKLIMGTNAEFPPFEYQEGGNVVGVDASIMQEVAKRLNLTLEIQNMEFDSLPAALTGKTIDVIAAGFTVKPDRQASMDFTDSYYTAQQTIIVSASSAVKSKDDLQGKKIGAQSGTTGFSDAGELTSDANIIGYSNGSLAVQALIAGQVDAVIIDNNPAKEYQSQQGDKIKLLENQFDPEDYAIAVGKGNTALQKAINDALSAMKSDGTLQNILDEFIK